MNKDQCRKSITATWDVFKRNELTYDDAIAVLAVILKEIGDKTGERDGTFVVLCGKWEKITREL
jgi:hypothetical protein